MFHCRYLIYFVIWIFYGCVKFLEWLKYKCKHYNKFHGIVFLSKNCFQTNIKLNLLNHFICHCYLFRLPENIKKIFSDVFRGYGKREVVWKAVKSQFLGFSQIQSEFLVSQFELFFNIKQSVMRYVRLYFYSKTMLYLKLFSNHL